ncbi:hypothetical protein vseg_002314 [Gypsophila vaccaria]
MEEIYVEAAKEITKLVVTRPLEQLKLAWGMKDQLVKLKQEFMYIQALLEDDSKVKHLSNQRSSSTQILNVWLKEVMDLAYYADDVMDDYAYQTLHKRAYNKRNNNDDGDDDMGRNKVLRSIFGDVDMNVPSCSAVSFKMTKEVVFRLRMSSKVEGILKSFDNLYRDATKLGIRPAEMGVTRGIVGGARSGDRMRTSVVPHHVVQESLDEVRELAVAHKFEFVGRRSDQDELTKLLLCHPDNGDQEVYTVVIVGMGGLGKTTLARQLYCNAAVIEHYAERFWICVSDNFTVKRILGVMLEKLTGGKCDLSNTEDIIHIVQQFLRGRRYLLVLDDVWHQNHSKWMSFRNCLLRIGGSTGSTVLVTTRNKDTARIVESEYIHELTGLSGEESWTFFVQKAFPKGIGAYDLEFQETGRRIVKKCDGLPLAINVIGGLLRMKADISEWKSVEKSKMWDLPQENNDIIPSLLLSFNNLPSSSLKQCFAYCAHFQPDALIDREDLINLWNAQGFLNCQSEGTRTPEELGQMYFDILLNNSLLQAETRHSFTGDVAIYHMHYLVHDLALYVSKHEWHIWKGVEKMSPRSDFRHLAILPNEGGITLEFPSEKLKRLRTLQAFTKLPKDDMLIHATNLRVLKLVAIGLEELPSAIVKFRHLRYIDLSHNLLVTLPDSITRLYHLQTVRLLSHKLKDLPKSLSRLINLRHLCLPFRSWCLPRGLQCLTNLQTLPMLELMEDHGCKISELGTLADIKGLLSISGLEHVKSKREAEKAIISQKQNITELQLVWGRGRVDNHFDVLDALQPHLNLKLLMITGYDSPNFPSWMMSMMTVNDAGIPSTPFYNLMQVELLYCETCQQLPALGHLPRLRELSMYSLCSVESIGNGFYHPANNLTRRLFPALKILIISSFEILKEWTIPEDQATVVFPLLETLKIEYCRELIRTPTDFPSLKHLHVNNSLEDLALCDVISSTMNPLTSLDINDAPNLVVLPDGLTYCTTLEELKLRSCPRLQSLPDGLGSRLVCLHKFSVISCPELTKIPTSIEECRSLKNLCIRDCHNLESIPDLSRLTHVEEVEISGCCKIRCLPSGLQTLPLLHSLSIGGCKSLNLELSGSAMSSDLLFPALKLVRIIGDNCIEEVPEWTKKLPLLQKLELKWCRNLKNLLYLSKLTTLVINSCILLQERCVKDGPEWSNISHIRFISINSKTIQEILT